VRALFGLVGLVVGAIGGWQAYARTGSWALAIFAGLLLANLIARGVADVITDPQKGRRLVFFMLPVLMAAAGVAAGYVLWRTWWVGVAVGVVAYIVGSVVAVAMFPRIAAEEAADSASRMGATPPLGPRMSEPDRDLSKSSSPYGNVKHL